MVRARGLAVLITATFVAFCCVGTIGRRRPISRIHVRVTCKTSYFRVAERSSFHDPAMADYAIKAAPPPAGPGITKVAVWDDEEHLGQGVAHTAAKEFTAKGGTDVHRQSYDPK